VEVDRLLQALTRLLEALARFTEPLAQLLGLLIATERHAEITQSTTERLAHLWQPLRTEHDQCDHQNEE
jgi:hypothetical protein